MTSGTVAGEEVASSEVRIHFGYNDHFAFSPRSQPLLDELLQLANAGGLLLRGGGAEGQGGAAVAS